MALKYLLQHNRMNECMSEWMNEEIKVQVFLKSWAKTAKRGYVFTIVCDVLNKKKAQIVFLLLVGLGLFHTQRQFYDSLGQMWRLTATSRETVLFLLLLCFCTPRSPLCANTRNHVAYLDETGFFLLVGFTTYASANTREKQLQSMWPESELVPFRSGHSCAILNRLWSSCFRKTYWDTKDALAGSLLVCMLFHLSTSANKRSACIYPF